MLPTPGTKSIRFEMTMKMKNVVANGKTQRVTRLSKISPIKPSQPSTIASITFCIPDGISLMFFQVLTRTTIKIIAATIQVQIIEFVTGSPKTLKIVGAADGTVSSAGTTEFAGVEIPPVESPTPVCEAGCAFRFTTKMATKNAQTKKILLNGFTVKNYIR